MSTNLPSYQNGSPHPIDNENVPKPVFNRGHTSFDTKTKPGTETTTNKPKVDIRLIAHISSIRAALTIGTE